MNPWEGQGTVLNNNGGMSTPDDYKPKRPIGDVIGSIATAFPSILCAINPRSCPQAVFVPPAPQQRREPNWLLIALGGFVAVLLLIILLRR